jgi:hypothetical protein
MRTTIIILAILFVGLFFTQSFAADDYVPLTGFFGTDIVIPVEACVDSDGDDYGNPASEACLHPQLDCDDSDPNVNPSMTEILENGKDDDCNPATPAYPEPANTIAMSYGRSSLIGSGVFNQLALLFIPVGVCLLLRIVHVRKRN